MPCSFQSSVNLIFTGSAAALPLAGRIRRQLVSARADRSRRMVWSPLMECRVKGSAVSRSTAQILALRCQNGVTQTVFRRALQPFRHAGALERPELFDQRGWFGIDADGMAMRG